MERRGGKNPTLLWNLADRKGQISILNRKVCKNKFLTLAIITAAPYTKIPLQLNM